MANELNYFETQRNKAFNQTAEKVASKSIMYFFDILKAVVGFIKEMFMTAIGKH